jgi:hypothetical protein
MSNKFEIGDDGSIFSISNDGTIHRVGKIDSQGNIEGQRKKSNKGWIVFLLLICIGMGIFAIYSYSEMERYSSSYYYEQIEIANLKSQLPQTYKVIVNQAKLYYLTCNEQHVYIDCVYKPVAIIDIYHI